MNMTPEFLKIVGRLNSKSLKDKALNYNDDIQFLAGVINEQRKELEQLRSAVNTAGRVEMINEIIAVMAKYGYGGAPSGSAF